MKKSESNSTGEFNIHYRHTARIQEQFPENDLPGLCRYIFEGIKSWGDPVYVDFPDGNRYYWGEYGTWLAHQFAAEGRIAEFEFIALLKEHNQEAIVMARVNVDECKKLIEASKQEVRQCEQKTQEAIACYHDAFEKYMIAKVALTKLESEANHDNK